jgi:tetratricopeptide (TPR) repeat protein/transcriptional regulator with XRE-family HTH domain
MEKDEDLPFGDLLGRFRTEARLSQQKLAEKVRVSRSTIVNWERGDHLPKERAYVLELAKHLRLTEAKRDLLLKAALLDVPTLLWYVPRHRNPFFTGREELLTTLHQRLAPQETTTLAYPCALSGLGGSGKTQMAVEYAYRYRQEYRAVLWLQADTKEALISSCIDLAQEFNLPERDETNQAVVVAAVRRWLKRHTRWLLIIDNVEDLSLVHTFLPTGYQGSVLLTTRLRITDPIADAYEIKQFSESEGILFLLHRAAIDTPAAHLDHASSDDYISARDLWAVMQGLPLALDQAGAYVRENGCSLRRYLELYKGRQNELLRRRGTPPDHPTPVTATFLLAFEQISTLDPAAGAFLRFCAFLAPEMIPEEIIVRGGRKLGSPLASVAEDQLLVEEMLGLLHRYSLVERHKPSQTLSIHRLVQDVIRSEVKQEEKQLWIERVMWAICEAFPSTGFAHWKVCERWLSHALTCTAWIESLHIAPPGTIYLLNCVGYYLQERGQYEMAERLSRRALEICEVQLGRKHPETATSMNNLASLYIRQGKYGEAELLCRQTLEIREMQVGREHPDTATCLNNLAYLYSEQGRYAEAEALYQEVLEIREVKLGKEHLETVSCLNNLALLYLQQGKYAQAEPLLQRALEIRKARLGKEHPDTARSFHNLALSYTHQGKYMEAEPLYQWAVKMYLQHLGEGHPDTARGLQSLAGVYTHLGKYREAEPLYKRALEISEQYLGGEHPDTAAAINELGHLYAQQGRDAEAEPLFQRALVIQKEQLGLDHPDTARSLNNLAYLYEKQGRFGEAESLHRHAQEIREVQLGKVHPDTARSLHNLASLHEQQGNDREAERLYQQALEIYQQCLEESHPDIAGCLNNLACLYRRQKRYTKAEPLYQQSLAICKECLGQAHPHTLLVQRNYCVLLRELGRDEEAALLEGLELR